jgi:hypothetical protein
MSVRRSRFILLVTAMLAVALVCIVHRTDEPVTATDDARRDATLASRTDYVDVPAARIKDEQRRAAAAERLTKQRLLLATIAVVFTACFVLGGRRATPGTDVRPISLSCPIHSSRGPPALVKS